jgi:hypothetical protein
MAALEGHGAGEVDEGSEIIHRATPAGRHPFAFVQPGEQQEHLTSPAPAEAPTYRPIALRLGSRLARAASVIATTTLPLRTQVSCAKRSDALVRWTMEGGRSTTDN